MSSNSGFLYWIGKSDTCKSSHLFLGMRDQLQEDFVLSTSHGVPGGKNKGPNKTRKQVSPCAEHDQGRLGPLGEALLCLHHVRSHGVIPVAFYIAEKIIWWGHNMDEWIRHANNICFFVFHFWRFNQPFLSNMIKAGIIRSCEIMIKRQFGNGSLDHGHQEWPLRCSGLV